MSLKIFYQKYFDNPVLMLTRITQFFGVLPLTIADTKSKVKPNDFVEDISSPVTEQKYKIKMSVYVIPWCILWRIGICAWMFFYFKFLKIYTDKMYPGDSIIYVSLVLHIVILLAGPMYAIVNTRTYVKLFNDLHACNQTLKNPLKLGHLVTGMTMSDIIWSLAPMSLVVGNIISVFQCDDWTSSDCILIPISLSFYFTIAGTTFVYVLPMNVLQTVLLDLQGNVRAISRSSIPHVRSTIKKVRSLFKIFILYVLYHMPLFFRIINN